MELYLYIPMITRVRPWFLDACSCLLVLVPKINLINSVINKIPNENVQFIFCMIKFEWILPCVEVLPFVLPWSVSE